MKNNLHSLIFHMLGFLICTILVAEVHAKQLKPLSKSSSLKKMEKIGLVHILDYNKFAKRKEHLVLDLRKFRSLYYDSIQNKLSYQRYFKDKIIITEEHYICRVTGVKFIWNVEESRSSNVLNRQCILIFENKPKRGSLLCLATIQSKIFLLDLILGKSMNCSQKMSIVNNEELNKNKNQFVNYFRRGSKKEMSITPEISNHYLYFSRYILYSKPAFIYPLSKGINTISTQQFKKIKVSLSDFDISFFFIEQKDSLEVFQLNTQEPDAILQEIKIKYEDILCDIMKRENLKVITEEEAKKLLLSSTINELPGQIFSGNCWSITTCNKANEYLLCFNRESFYSDFKDSFVTAVSLFHLMDRYQKIYDKINNKQNINSIIDNFISQNIERYPDQVLKEEKELKANPDLDAIHKVYPYTFKKPISQELLFLKDAEKDLIKKRAKNYVKQFCNDVRNLKEEDISKAKELVSNFNESEFELSKKNEQNIKLMAGIIK